MRLLEWEETWDALGVGAWLSVQEAGVLHMGSQLSAPVKQDSELAVLGSSLGLYPGKSPGWLGMTKNDTEPGSLFWLMVLRGPVCGSSRCLVLSPAACQRDQFNSSERVPGPSLWRPGRE